MRLTTFTLLPQKATAYHTSHYCENSGLTGSGLTKSSWAAHTNGLRGHVGAEVMPPRPRPLPGASPTSLTLSTRPFPRSAPIQGGTDLDWNRLNSDVRSGSARGQWSWGLELDHARRMVPQGGGGTRGGGAAHAHGGAGPLQGAAARRDTAPRRSRGPYHRQAAAVDRHGAAGGAARMHRRLRAMAGAYIPQRHNTVRVCG
jgi:hypothetical protein